MSAFIKLGDRAQFTSDRFRKVDIASGEFLFLGLNCFEPGQSQALHTHKGSDKFYLVLSGRATLQVGDVAMDVEPEMLIWAPATIPHGVTDVAEPTVLLVGMAPGPASH